MTARAMTDAELDALLTGLRSRTLSASQYVRLSRAVSAMQGERSAAARRRLVAGTAVTWDSPRRGCRIAGVISRILRKNAQVREDGTGQLWRVPLSILEAR